MTKADKKHIGSGAQGKGSGEGAMTDIDKDKIEENAVLSNRDKAQHTRQRGLDSKEIETEQYHDHPGNRMPDD